MGIASRWQRFCSSFIGEPVRDKTTRLLEINTPNIEKRLGNAFKIELQIGAEAKIIEIGRKDADPREQYFVISHQGKVIPYQFFSCRRGVKLPPIVNVFVKP